jgi:intein-encoded DNA endonuclease-like protein
VPIFKNKNEDFFKKWSPEMAYVLGFFAADGCMIKNKRGAHFIEFHIVDKNLLIRIRKALNSNHKIATRKIKDGWKSAHHLQIGSKEIFNDLLFLGMTPNKSNSLIFPNIKEEYLSHFIRGYFDGDGNVFLGKRSDRINRNWILQSGFTSGSKEFIKELKIKLKKFANIAGSTQHYSSGAYRLCFSIKDSLKLYEFMYSSNESLFLPRKKRIFEKYIKMDR